MRFKRAVAVVAAGSMVGAMLVTSPSSAASRDTKLVTALSGVSGNRVALAAPSVSDHDSVAQTAFVDIPHDPRKGVRLVANGQTSIIGLPNAVHLHNGVKLANGTVVYRNDDGSAQVVIPTTQNNVQFLTVVEKADAPENYTYPVNTGNGKVVLAEQGGSAAVFDGAKPVAFVAKPWAQAADGKEVFTRFNTDGKTLTQYIAHKVKGTSYPVVGDPHVQWYWNGAVVTLSRAEMATVAYGGTQALIPMLLIPGVGWGMIVGVLGMAAYAGWAYANHKCAWFWLSFDGPNKLVRLLTQSVGAAVRVLFPDGQTHYMIVTKGSYVFCTHKPYSDSRHPAFTQKADCSRLHHTGDWLDNCYNRYCADE